MKRTLSNKQIHKISAYLAGSCLSLDSVLAEYNLKEDDLTLADCLALDEEVLLCSTCGWWLQVEEFGESDVCLECEEDEFN